MTPFWLGLIIGAAGGSIGAACLYVLLVWVDNALTPDRADREGPYG